MQMDTFYYRHSPRHRNVAPLGTAVDADDLLCSFSLSLCRLRVVWLSLLVGCLMVLAVISVLCCVAFWNLTAAVPPLVIC